MNSSLQVFMNGIIDYAGLFPPAQLSLDTSIHNFARYKKGEDADMLSRFIIPASQLHRLEDYGNELFKADPPFDFSVLGKGTEMIADFGDAIEDVIENCEAFNNAHGDTVTTELLEMKLPKEAAFSNDVNLIVDLLNRNAERFAENPQTPSCIFYETIWEENWKNDIQTALKAIEQHNESIEGDDESYRYAGFKIRCGGVEAHMFPSAEQVAFALNKAREYNVAIKCTAGLHHPVRHYNDSVQTRMHGFFNVFGGAMLAYAHNLSDEELVEILIEEDPAQFSFTDKGLSFDDYFIPTKEIEELREVALISYGSCSFEEPI
ncbi:MAG: hypothetical protein U5J95_10805 [Balneolaceae bacterium]|nr:hypothetical protein [Balneolaceae bacterium]